MHRQSSERLENGRAGEDASLGALAYMTLIWQTFKISSLTPVQLGGQLLGFSFPMQAK
jgi:hypothetical protein